MDLTSHHAPLHHLTRTDPDPRVRHRADGLLLVASSGSQMPPGASAARATVCDRGPTDFSLRDAMVWPIAVGLAVRRSSMPERERCSQRHWRPHRWSTAIR